MNVARSLSANINASIHLDHINVYAMKVLIYQTISVLVMVRTFYDKN